MALSVLTMTAGRNLRQPLLAAALLLALVGWTSISVAQPKLYRWVDENGNVQYSDQVPPSEADKARTRLSDEGVQVESVPRAPTREEREHAEAQKRKEAEEARRRAEQKSADEMLLKTYRTVEELTLARNGKVAAVDALIQVKRDGVRAETKQLLALHAEKKKLEEAGKPVPKELADKIDQSVMRIRAGYADVVDNEYRKQAIRNEFRQIVERYRTLKGLPSPPSDQSKAESELKLSILVGCKGETQCMRYWDRAIDYVRSHSDNTREVRGPGLLIAFQDDAREYRSLTLSWTQQAADRPVHLYLDVQCKNRQTGSLLCVNPTIPQIRDGFHASVIREDETGE